MRIVETYDIENFGKVAKVSAKIEDIVYVGRDGQYKVSCSRCCFNSTNVKRSFCYKCYAYVNDRDDTDLNNSETIYFVRLTATNKNKL